MAGGRERTCPTRVRMRVLRRRASLCSETRICWRMISAEVIGRRALGDPDGWWWFMTPRPGEPGAEDGEDENEFMRRAVDGCEDLCVQIQ